MLNKIKRFLFGTPAVRDLLLRAKDAMNDAGAHWIQGDMCRVVAPLDEDERYLGTASMLAKDPRKCGFCAVGALRFAAFGDYEVNSYEDEPFELYKNGLDVLAHSPVVVDFHTSTKSSSSTYLGTLEQPVPHFGDLEGVVIAWNDYSGSDAYDEETEKYVQVNAGTSWAEVEAGFLRAALAAGGPVRRFRARRGV